MRAREGRADKREPTLPRLVTLRSLSMGPGETTSEGAHRGHVAHLRLYSGAPLPLPYHYLGTGSAYSDYDVSKVPQAFYSWLEMQAQASRDRGSSRELDREREGAATAVVLAAGLIITLQLPSTDGRSSADIDFLLTHLEREEGEPLSTYMNLDSSDSVLFERAALDISHCVQVVHPSLQTNLPRPPHLFPAHCLRAPPMSMATAQGQQEGGAGGQKDKVVGLNKATKAVLEALLPSLLPTAVLAQLKAEVGVGPKREPGVNVTPKYSQTVLISGPEGSGKTHLVRAVTTILTQSSSVLAATRFLSSSHWI